MHCYGFYHNSRGVAAICLEVSSSTGRSCCTVYSLTRVDRRSGRIISWKRSTRLTRQGGRSLVDARRPTAIIFHGQVRLLPLVGTAIIQHHDLPKAKTG